MSRNKCPSRVDYLQIRCIIYVEYHEKEGLNVFVGIVIALLLVLCITLYCYRSVFYYPANKRSSPDAPILGKQHAVFADDIRHITRIMSSVPCEEITITSFDGLKLYGRYYHVRDGAPIQLMFHGYQSCAFRDCSGGHALSRKMGLNALVVDQRAHGNSDGTTISFGVNERLDCLSWIEYANSRFGNQVSIILNGLSMGAATVLMAADLPLPDNVECIVADSPYSSPSAIIRKVCRDRHFSPLLVMPFIHLAASLFGKFDLNGSSAVSAVRKATIPVLLIHGESDRFVPCEMSTQIAAACRTKVTLETFPDTGHGLAYLVDPIRYEQIVFDFYNSIPSISKWIDSDYYDSHIHN